jgi:hypothetical protein
MGVVYLLDFIVFWSRASDMRPLFVKTLSALANVGERSCKKVLQALSSLLLYKHIQDEPICVMHPSFVDLVTDARRCIKPEHLVHVVEHHARLADCCLQLLNEHLRANICNMTDPSLPNVQVHDLQERLNRIVPPELLYASRFWHVHLSKYMDITSESTQLPDSLDLFVSEHLLHWLELASLLGEISTVLSGMRPLLVSLEAFPGS